MIPARALAVIVVAVIAAGISPSGALAVKGSDRVTVIGTQADMSYDEIIGRHRLLSARAAEQEVSSSSRLKDIDGTPADFMMRYEEFLRSSYSQKNIAPDSVTYDTGSASIIVLIRFPLKVIRWMGTGTAADNIHIPIATTPARTKEILSESNALRADMTSHMNRNGHLVIDRIRVTFRGKEIYAE